MLNNYPDFWFFGFLAALAAGVSVGHWFYARPEWRRLRWFNIAHPLFFPLAGLYGAFASLDGPSVSTTDWGIFYGLHLVGLVGIGTSTLPSPRRWWLIGLHSATLLVAFCAFVVGGWTMAPHH